MQITAPLPITLRDSLDKCGKDNVWGMSVNDGPIDPNDQELDDHYSSNFGSIFDSISSKAPDKNQDDATADDDLQELLVSGLHYAVDGNTAAVEIRRGMTILTTEGAVAGTVAGVINNRDPKQVKYILLSRPSQQLEYRMVPIELVRQVGKETVLLHILSALVSTLLPWHRSVDHSP